MPTYPLNTPDEVWETWKDTVPSSYPRLEHRFHEHIATDLLEQHDELDPRVREWCERTLEVTDA